MVGDAGWVRSVTRVCSSMFGTDTVDTQYGCALTNSLGKDTTRRAYFLAMSCPAYFNRRVAFTDAANELYQSSGSQILLEIERNEPGRYCVVIREMVREKNAHRFL